MEKIKVAQKNETESSLKEIKRNSFLVSILLSFYLISASINVFIRTELGTGNMLGLFTGGLFLLFIILDEGLKIRKDILIFIMYILFFIFVSMMIPELYNNAILTLINFAFFGILSIFIGAKSYNTRIVFEYSIYISLILLISFPTIISNQSETIGYYRIGMGISYALLPTVLCAVSHFIYYRNHANKIIWIGYFSNAYILYLLFTSGTRGSNISILIYVFLLIVNKYEYFHNNSIKPVRRKLILHGTVITMFLFVINFKNVMLSIYELSKKIGIKISIIEKSMYLFQESGDISNSRFKLYKLSLDGIKESPLWGNGIGSFQVKTGFNYPHNFILDLLYEGGALLTIPILTILILTVYVTVFGKVKNRNNYAMLIVLISSSLPRLMISTSVWTNQIIWLLIGFSFTRIIKYKSNRL